MDWIKLLAYIVDIVLLALIWYSAYRHGARIGAERAMEEQRKRNRDFEQRITNLTNRVWGTEKEIRELKESLEEKE